MKIALHFSYFPSQFNQWDINFDCKYRDKGDTSSFKKLIYDKTNKYYKYMITEMFDICYNLNGELLWKIEDNHIPIVKEIISNKNMALLNLNIKFSDSHTINLICAEILSGNKIRMVEVNDK
jgi:hypothetical protein